MLGEFKVVKFEDDILELHWCISGMEGSHFMRREVKGEAEDGQVQWWFDSIIWHPEKHIDLMVWKDEKEEQLSRGRA